LSGRHRFNVITAVNVCFFLFNDMFLWR